MSLKHSLFAVTSAILISTSSFASHKGFYKSGLYTGVSLGYSRMNAKVNDSIFYSNAANYAGVGSSSSNGIVGGLDIGFRNIFQNGFLFGIEVGIVRDNDEISKHITLSNTITTSTKLKSSYAFTPNIVFGKTLSSRWLAFSKLGLSLRKFTGTHSTMALGASINDKFSTRKTGFLAAVGAEYAFNNKLSAVGSVAYERFGNINRSLPVTAGIAGEQNRLTIKNPSYITAKVGIIYKF